MKRDCPALQVLQNDIMVFSWEVQASYLEAMEEIAAEPPLKEGVEVDKGGGVPIAATLLFGFV